MPGVISFALGKDPDMETFGSEFFLFTVHFGCATQDYVGHALHRYHDQLRACKVFLLAWHPERPNDAPSPLAYSSEGPRGAPTPRPLSTPIRLRVSPRAYISAVSRNMRSRNDMRADGPPPGRLASGGLV